MENQGKPDDTAFSPYPLIGCADKPRGVFMLDSRSSPVNLYYAFGNIRPTESSSIQLPAKERRLSQHDLSRVPTRASLELKVDPLCSIDEHSSSSMAPSERSISSGSSNASPPPNLVALPSMTHSLAALPTMSSLPHDMMHYNAAAHSRARMEYALQKQRQQGPVHAALNAYDVRRSPSPALAEDSQITVRRQQNAKQSSSRDRR